MSHKARKRISLTLSQEALDALDAQAQASGLARAQFIEQASLAKIASFSDDKANSIEKR